MYGRGLTVQIGRPPTIPRSEYRLRRVRAAVAARERGLDGLLVWSMGGSTLDSFGDVFYLTNHYCTETKAPDVTPHWSGFGHAAVLLTSDGAATLLVGPPNWRDDLVTVDEVLSDRDLYGLVERCLRDKGLSSSRLGLSREQLVPLPLYSRLRDAFPKLRLERADDILEEMREVKSEAEIVLMRHAQNVSVQIMDAMFSEIREGITDADLASVGFAVASRLGATPYEFAMASGPYSDHAYYPRLPAFDPWRLYERGDIIHPDVYGCVDGYFYDFVRCTVVGGDPTEAQREVLEGAIACVHHVCDQLRPGVRACDVHAAAVEWKREHNWGLPPVSLSAKATDFSTFDAFGHGIGLGWEGPWIVPGDETVLQPGMTIAIETYVTREGGGTALYEETVLVTENGPEIMTGDCPARWW